MTAAISPEVRSLDVWSFLLAGRVMVMGLQLRGMGRFNQQQRAIHRGSLKQPACQSEISDYYLNYGHLADGKSWLLLICSTI